MLKVDFSELFAGLDGLNDIKESLARQMLVPAGQALRDEARSNAPIGNEVTGGYHADKTGSIEPGALRDSIYLAYQDKASKNGIFSYVVSWNSRALGVEGGAFWGKWAEFGYIRKWKVAYDEKDNRYFTLGPKWAQATGNTPRPFTGPNAAIPGSYFLGRSYDQTLPQLQAIMVDAGKRAWAELVGSR